MATICITVFCFATTTTHTPLYEPATTKPTAEPVDFIYYRVDGYDVKARLLGEPQGLIMRDTLTLSFKCEGKYEVMNKKDTLDFVCTIPYHFPAPVYIATFSENRGLFGCNYSCVLGYSPLIWYSGYATGADESIGSFKIYPPALLDAKGGAINGRVTGLYRVQGDFELKEAVITGASPAPECDHATDLRMEKNIFPWYDPKCITLQKKMITNGRFSIKMKLIFM